MAIQASKAQFYAAMQGTETTNQWDVLVSYSEESLNEYLRRSWAGSEKLSSVHFEVSLPTPANFPVTTIYDLKLHPSSLQFITTESPASAHLKMGLEGKLTTKINGTDYPVDIPPNIYGFEVRVPIVAIKGDGSGSQTSDSIIHFDDENESSYYITFHFGNEGSHWAAFASEEAEKKIKDSLDAAVESIRVYFLAKDHLNSIDYSIAEVSNTKSTATSNLLTPKSFTFSSQKGVLNIFIKTEGSGRGEGHGNPRFGLEYNKNYTPIPQGYGASIIIARELFQDKYLIPNIIKLGTSLSSKDPVTAREVEKGITLELRYQDDLITKRIIQSHPMDKIEFGPLTFNFEKNPLLLQISDNGGDLSPQYSWSWEHEGEWEYKEDPNGNPFVLSNPESKSLRYKTSVNENSKSLVTLNDHQVDIDIEFLPENQPKFTTEEKGPWIPHPDIKMNELSLKLPELNFFRSSNIFAPGKTLMLPTDVLLPYDMVLLGQINSQVE